MNFVFIHFLFFCSFTWVIFFDASIEFLDHGWNKCDCGSLRCACDEFWGSFWSNSSVHHWFSGRNKCRVNSSNGIDVRNDCFILNFFWGNSNKWWVLVWVMYHSGWVDIWQDLLLRNLDTWPKWNWFCIIWIRHILVINWYSWSILVGIVFKWSVTIQHILNWNIFDCVLIK